VEEEFEVVVVGGGQAGLTVGYYLREERIPFVILDAHERPGDAWRRRWDTLELFTPARYSSLPEMRFPGDPERFPGKDEVAEYMEQYAAEFQLPMRLGQRATAIARADGGFRVNTGSGQYNARQVIVATGAYQRPYVPPIASQLDADVTQVHSEDYRNAAQISDDEVLVVGAANSGAQIAEDLASRHRVRLSQGTRLPRLPRRILGRSLHWWGERIGLFTAPLEGSLRGRTQRGDLLIGPSLRQISRRHDIELLPRAIRAEGHKIGFEDGRSVDVQAVVWATGFRSDYSWIELPVFDERGLPRHRRGVTDEPGLYFLGMHRQYSRGSSLIWWVRHDARHIVERITEASG
jgi:putative flavoprotein involved in K+ transport